MNTTHCKKCDADLAISGLTEDQKLSVRNTKISGGTLVAIKELNDTTDLSLKEAKNVVLHVTGESGACNRCGAVLPSGFEVECGQCGSFNLVWMLD